MHTVCHLRPTLSYLMHLSLENPGRLLGAAKYYMDRRLPVLDYGMVGAVGKEGSGAEKALKPTKSLKRLSCQWSLTKREYNFVATMA